MTDLQIDTPPHYMNGTASEVYAYSFLTTVQTESVVQVRSGQWCTEVEKKETI